MRTPDHGSTSPDSTGPLRPLHVRRTVTTECGPFTVKVIVSDTGKYLGVAEVKLSQQFLTHATSLSSTGYLDLDEPEG